MLGKDFFVFSKDLDMRSNTQHIFKNWYAGPHQRIALKNTFLREGKDKPQTRRTYLPNIQLIEDLYPENM